MALMAPVCICDSPLAANIPGRSCPVHGTKDMRDRLAAAEKARDWYREELDGIYGIVEHSDTALYSAVKHSKKRVTGSP